MHRFDRQLSGRSMPAIGAGFAPAVILPRNRAKIAFRLAFRARVFAPASTVPLPPRAKCRWWGAAMSNSEFGRRGAAQNDTAPKRLSGAEPDLNLAELLRSPLMRQLSGIFCGVLLLFCAVAVYVGMMKGAGRAL